NLIHDGSDEVVGLFPETANGGQGAATKAPQSALWNTSSCGYKGGKDRTCAGDTGSAARFFYCAKASPEERRNSKHPTIKPVALMRYLVRLVTPPGGLVLDPFGGSGTTAEAARLEHCRFLL
ncbi:MAG: DNA methyltransferase, partial [Planctomyces sp.]